MATFVARQTEAAYFNCVEMDEKVVLSFVPTPLTAVIMATAMPAAIRPYSMAVAPESSARNCIRAAIIAASIGPNL